MVVLALVACTPALPEEAQTADDLARDWIVALTAAPPAKKTRDGAVLLVDDDGHVARIDAPGMGIPHVVADSGGLYFGDGTHEVALTSGQLKRTQRGKTVQNAEAMHVLPGGDRVSIYADGAAHVSARTSGDEVELSRIPHTVLGTAACGDQVYAVAEDGSRDDDGFHYLLLDALADPKDQVIGRWSPGQDAEPPMSAACDGSTVSFVHETIVPGREAVDETQVVRWDVRRGKVTTPTVTGADGTYVGDLEPTDEPGLMAGFAEGGYWQLDLKTGRVERLFSHDQSQLVTSARAGGIVYLLEADDDTTALRAIDAETGREIAAQQLGSLASDVSLNDLGLIGLTVMRPAGSWAADTN